MRRAVAAVALAMTAVAAPPAHAADDSPGEWLSRMTTALTTLDYEGLFTHSTGTQSETMRIVHCVRDGRSTERLVSLDGSGREIVRTSEEVHLYLPDRQVVLVEPRSDDGSLLRALPKPGPKLDAVYTMSLRKGNRMLGRDVRILDIQPRDSYRYGYRLWLDEQTAMPLRSEIVDSRGHALEAIHFTQLEVGQAIAASELEPQLDATGYRWVRHGKRAEQRVAAASWQVRNIPPGFKLVASRLQMVPGQPMPVQHLIFSDGVASVSVFIEPGPAKGPAPPEATRVGSANAFTTQVSGHVVTAVGEVPATTVRDIASSLQPAGTASPAAGSKSEPGAR
jgi:sigma-E factor negative regulatory protein RseB